MSLWEFRIFRILSSGWKRVRGVRWSRIILLCWLDQLWVSFLLNLQFPWIFRMWCGCSEYGLASVWKVFLFLGVYLRWSWWLSFFGCWNFPWLSATLVPTDSLWVDLAALNSTLDMEYGLSVAFLLHDNIIISRVWEMWVTIMYCGRCLFAKHSKNHKIPEPNPDEWDILEFPAILRNWFESSCPTSTWVAFGEEFEFRTTYEIVPEG